MLKQLIDTSEPVHFSDVTGDVETQQGMIEIQAFWNGARGKWKAGIGSDVPVGTLSAVNRATGDPEEPDLPEPTPHEPTPREAPQPVDPVTEPRTPEEVPLNDPSPTQPLPEIPQTPDFEIPTPEDMRWQVAPEATLRGPSGELQSQNRA